MVPGGQKAAVGLLVASTAMSLAGSVFGPESEEEKTVDKVKELKDAVVEGFETLVADINKQNRILKGCVESLHAWTQQRLISLEKENFRHFLQVKYMEAVEGLSTLTEYSSVKSVARFLSDRMYGCQTFASSALRIIDESPHKLSEAVSLLSVVDEYMNVCNQFAAGFQVAHNFNEDSIYQNANHKFHQLEGYDYKREILEPHRYDGFNLINLVFSRFIGYFSGLEVRVLMHNLPDKMQTQLVVKRFKYKALSLQREWLWVKEHHEAGKLWPSRLNPIGNRCSWQERKQPTCRVCYGTGNTYGCYERVTGKIDVDGSIPWKYDVVDGYVQCHYGVFFPKGTNTCNHKGIEGYDGLTGQWLAHNHALRGTFRDPQKRENGGPGVPRRRRSAPVAGSCPPWHACCSCLR